MNPRCNAYPKMGSGRDTEGTLTLSGKDPSPFRAVPTIGGDNGRHVGECLESGGRTKLNKIELNGNQGELPRRARHCSTNLPLTADVALKERTKRRR
ncbi:unnamed protein product [Acanthocheilonema viteae]|uniref:Uncharacterized protein n=1 Tax=Acanthocheilonema viteae TaxID=6277 RepID=A0A498SF12_ACAVI|nr:unnamed protein product [Acanthocheilonema viteae]